MCIVDGGYVMKGNLGRLAAYHHPAKAKYRGGSLDALDYNMNVHRAPFIDNPETGGQNRNTAFQTERIGGMYTNYASYSRIFDIRSTFANFRGRAIDSRLYMGNNNDYNGAYDVSEVFFRIDQPRTGHLYIAHQHTLDSGSYRWQNDTPIGGIQILDAGGRVIHAIEPDSAFPSPGVFYQNNGNYSSLGTPATVAAYTTWNNLRTDGQGSPTNQSNNVPSAGYWNRRNSTGSQSTGADHGVPISSTDPLPVGDGTLGQIVNKNYWYKETSPAATWGRYGYMKSQATYSFPEKGSIRIAFCNTTGHTTHNASNNNMNLIDPDQTLFVGMY
jgi:hypothetical protein